MERSITYQYRKKKTRAREIVLLALLTALVVAASIVCAVTVPVHLGTALVVMIGAAMGKRAGAWVGAMAMLLNNFYLGQGTWTPFQMTAMGLVGFFAGFFFNGTPENTGLQGKKRSAVMAVYTFLAVIFIYGGIMNFATFLCSGLMMGTTEGLNGKSLLACYASGILYDISHGGTAAVCVVISEQRFTQKLERIQLKYGFYR